MVWCFHRRYSALVSVLLCLASNARAQEADTVRLSPAVGALVTPAGHREDSARISLLLGGAGSRSLLRSTSTLTPDLSGPGSVRWQLIAPDLRVTWNSAIPLSLNDGAMWAGRGATTALRAGGRAAFGPVTVTLAPEIVYSENRSYAIIPASLSGRSAFSYPWRLDSLSMDLPPRFGNEPLLLLDPGESSLVVAGPRLSFGASTESQWWGPGVRNALVISSNSAGIPHLFLRSAGPVRTRLGDVEGRWIAGGLVESIFFDSDSTNDLRALSAFALTLRPRWEPDLTIGVARAVYGPADDAAEVLRRSTDAWTHWRAAPVADTAATDREQILSLFGRWLFPSEGVEVYAEWARLRLPASFRDFLLAPNHTQGYTLGLQYARPLAAATLRAQAELTYLEKSSTVKQRPVPTYYTSRGVPQGYTHRGQAVGAAIGPGSSSQWLAGDYVAPRWQAGLFAGRVRWNSDFLAATPSPHPGREVRSGHAFDVSILGGLRAAASLAGVRLGGDFTVERRLNYLFQNPDLDFTSPGAVTIHNGSLRLFLEASR